MKEIEEKTVNSINTNGVLDPDLVLQQYVFKQLISMQLALHRHLIHLKQYHNNPELETMLKEQLSHVYKFIILFIN